MKEDTLTIPQVFGQSVVFFPEKIALQVKKDNLWHKFTYREVAQYSLKLAAYLVKEGLNKGDCVGLILENRPEWAIIYLGIVCAGLVCVPIDPQLSQEEIRNLLTDSQAKIIFCSYDILIRKIRQEIRGGLNKVIILDAPDTRDERAVDFRDIERMAADENTLPSVLPQDIASLIYTSGTTAQPKGVLLSHANLCSNFQSIKKLNICLPADNILAILPLYHTYAFMVTLLVPLGLGAKVTYASSFKPQEITQLIKEAGITILVGVPQFFSLLHKAVFEQIKKIPFLFRPFVMPAVKFKLRRQEFRNLRLMISGGARLEPKVGCALSDVTGVKLIEGYGLTETSPVVTFNPPQRIKIGSVGIPIPDVQLKVISPDAQGIGQVLIKGPNVMQGYFKQPEATEKVIKDGWFYSGDLGRQDKAGYLFLSGREKEVIVLTSGKNIYPEELEAVYGNSQYIKEICVINRQEERFGNLAESLYAVVVPNLEYFRQKNETDIRRKIRWELENLGRSLPSYQHVMGFIITKEELPRTALKKVKRYLVRQKYSSGENLGVDSKENIILQEELRGLPKELAQKIVDYMSEQLNKPVGLDSHLEIDLGIDSFGRVELGLGLEQLLNASIPDDLVSGVSTVRELIASISRITDTAMPSKYKEAKAEKNWGDILNRPIQGGILDRIKLNPGLLGRLLTSVFHLIFSFILRTFWLLKIRGRRNLPLIGPYLLCPNHSSYLDGFIIFSSLPPKEALKTFFLGYSDIFEHPLIVGVSRLARLIPIDPYKRFTDALQAASFVLKDKKVVCIFPEGRRSIDGNIGEFKRGIGILAKELGIPVIPVRIKGSYESWPRYRLLPHPYPLEVIFGKPVYPEELKMSTAAFSEDKTYSLVAEKIREEVVRLKC